jgi:hypothetical protein
MRIHGSLRGWQAFGGSYSGNPAVDLDDPGPCGRYRMAESHRGNTGIARTLEQAIVGR